VRSAVVRLLLSTANKDYIVLVDPLHVQYVTLGSYVTLVQQLKMAKVIVPLDFIVPGQNYNGMKHIMEKFHAERGGIVPKVRPMTINCVRRAIFVRVV
jgi:hypothetical protein